MNISAKVAGDLYEMDRNEEAHGWRKVLDDHDSLGRWHERRRVVVQNVDTGKYYEFHYELGTTEYQDNIFPWEDDDHEVALFPVNREVMTIVVFTRV